MRFDCRHLRLALGPGPPCCAGPAALAAFAASPIAAAPPPWPPLRCFYDICPSSGRARLLLIMRFDCRRSPAGPTSLHLDCHWGCCSRCLRHPPIAAAQPISTDSAGVHLRSTIAPRMGAAHPDHHRTMRFVCGCLHLALGPDPLRLAASGHAAPATFAAPPLSPPPGPTPPRQGVHLRSSSVPTRDTASRP